MAKVRNIEFSTGGIARYVFFCPGCKEEHQIDTSWTFNQNYEKPTFSPSVLWNPKHLNPNKHICHSFVRDGKIQFLSDCTHELAGQTVELPDIER